MTHSFPTRRSPDLGDDTVAARQQLADECQAEAGVGAGDEAVAGCLGASLAGCAFRGGGSGAGDQGPAQAAPAPSRDLWPSVQLPDRRYDGGTIPPFLPAQECPCPLQTSAAPPPPFSSSPCRPPSPAASRHARTSACEGRNGLVRHVT